MRWRLPHLLPLPKTLLRVGGRRTSMGSGDDDEDERVRRCLVASLPSCCSCACEDDWRARVRGIAGTR